MILNDLSKLIAQTLKITKMFNFLIPWKNSAEKDQVNFMLCQKRKLSAKTANNTNE